MCSKKILSSSGEIVNLAQLHRNLQSKLGDSAPSLITLKRHAAAGLLKPVDGLDSAGAGRKLYEVKSAIDLYKGRSPQPQTDVGEIISEVSSRMEARVTELLRSSATPIKEATLLSGDQMTELAEKVAALLAPQLAKVTDQISGLSGLRNTLMLKYDAVTALSQQKAERLEQELTAMRQEAGMDVRISKITQQLANLTSAVHEIRSSLEQRGAS